MQQQIPNRDSDGPITISSEIDTASLSEGKVVVELQTTETRMGASNRATPERVSMGEHRHLQYTERKPGSRSHRPWRMGVTNNFRLSLSSQATTD